MDKQGIYIMSISLHGLIRTNSPELGRDADTGGQVKYVLEMAKVLGELPEVAKVDLLTRYIDDETVGSDYARNLETISARARLVRLRCGGRKYLRKELLWPHLEEYIDQVMRFIKQQGRTPDLVHGHYADAGYVARELAAAFDVPFVFTGHSMGRNKRKKLLADGLAPSKMEQQYKMKTRIATEEEIIGSADLIVTSTSQEIERQYGLYSSQPAGVFRVIPPGLDLETFYPYYDVQLDPELLNEEVKQTRVALLKELHRFWTVPEKPFILALCRPDQRKNISGLIQAYGNSRELQAAANLAVFAGIRSDIAAMEENERAVLTDMLLDMDRYDLYGRLAIPKKHNFSIEVPELYRLCAESGGVFVNPALVEPFGLTLIEAAACGLPIVATDDGGPVEIVGKCQNGLLVDVADPKAIALAIGRIIYDHEQWQNYSNSGINGVRSHYSWQAHGKSYLQAVQELLPAGPHPSAPAETPAERQRPSFGRRLLQVGRLLLTDIDNTLVGAQGPMRQLFELLTEKREDLAWGVATGRSLELTIEVMTEHDFPMPDILVCSVGTEIYYGPDLRIDKGWQKHISYHWKPEAIKDLLDRVSCLRSQEAEGQRSHKISYYLEEAGQLDTVRDLLRREKLGCQVIYSHGQFLDILPLRASKGRAAEYLRYKYQFSPRQLLVAGDSGNDEDMLNTAARAVVVGNHSDELLWLKNRPNVYFSPHNCAAGILDGLRHYGFV